MTQEELLENYIDTIPCNLNDKTTLELVLNLLDNVSNNLYENGYITESNRITTAILIVKEVLENEF